MILHVLLKFSIQRVKGSFVSLVEPCLPVGTGGTKRLPGPSSRGVHSRAWQNFPHPA